LFTGYLFIALTVLLTVYGQLVLKWQVSLVGPLPHGAYPKLAFLGHMLLNPWVISGLGAAFAASLCWMLALKKLPLSTAYPFTASSFILILLFAAVFLHEPITAGKLAGTALIVAGIAIMAVTA
jgi:multidrug transporter EmrE-like cation transporter